MADKGNQERGPPGLKGGPSLAGCKEVPNWPGGDGYLEQGPAGWRLTIGQRASIVGLLYR